MQPERYNTGMGARDIAYDAGLRSHFQRVYNTMAAGLVLTALSAFGVSQTPQLMELFYNTPMRWVVMFAPLAFVFLGFTPARMQRSSPGAIMGLFMAFSVVLGISIAYIFQVYSGESITRVFFITSGMFAATSIYGYTSRRDLSSMGSLMMMGLIGIIIASIVNIFMQSAMMQFVVSVLSVIIFTGLTAWETQNIKETYSYAHGRDSNAKLAVMGALSLYLNFINLFMSLLQLFGNRN